jgi:hypothetical protein
MKDKIFLIMKPIKQVVSDYSNLITKITNNNWISTTFSMKTTYREQNGIKLKRNYTIAINISETPWY